MIQIPLYRAQVEGIGKMSESQVKLLNEIDGCYYAIGFYSFLDNEHGITDLNGYYWIVKGNTNSISFDDMLNKNSKKIFASLSEDGIGSDLVMIDDVKYYMELIGSSIQLCDINEDEIGNSNTLGYGDYHRCSLEEAPCDIKTIEIHKG